MPRSRIPSVLPGRLRHWWPWNRSVPAQPTAAAEDPLLQSGRLLRRRREALGLSLRQLSIETRISTPVLEALERGWRDRLPEPAYLRTMLPLLEQRLELPGGALEQALPVLPQRDAGVGARRPLLARFTPGSIDVFTTWQGTVLYGVITLGLIYGVNLQQQRLAAANLLTQRPIPALPAAEQNTPPDPNAALLQVYPDLRPLQQAAHGVALQRLLQAGDSRIDPMGVLRLRLARPTRLSLRSESGQRSELQGASGELVLQLQPPIRLKLDPPGDGNAVFWDDQPLLPEAGRGGSYRVPPVRP
jgi:transcriptional regulator with XRE-family HTH domain